MKATPAPKAAFLAEALRRLGRRVTPTRRRLLQVHFQMPQQRATMSQLAQAMGWSSYSTANLNYGVLARLVGQESGFQPDRRCHLLTLCTFRSPQEPGDHWLIFQRPEVTAALQELGWV